MGTFNSRRLVWRLEVNTVIHAKTFSGLEFQVQKAKQLKPGVRRWADNGGAGERSPWEDNTTLITHLTQ